MESKIIAIRKEDINLANEAFADLMLKTEKSMNDFSRSNPSYFEKMKPSKFEVESCEMIKKACYDTPFNPNNVILVSGHSFPDIIADNYYGIEVKSTIANHWTSIGSSIVESTRKDLVENIYMLFGKLGGKPPEFKCRPYSAVLSEIAVTHSPRYLINMELQDGETIFDKMHTTYNDFRTSDDNIAIVREYYKQKAVRDGKQEMPWWISKEDIEKPIGFNLRLWKTIDTGERKLLTAYCLILFPEIWSIGANNKTKYNQASLWLCSFRQVIHPNVRDIFTAGGKIISVNGFALKKEEQKPHVIKTLVDSFALIKLILTNPNKETLDLICEYNPSLLKGGNLFENWFNNCCANADSNNAPLEEWFKNPPTFICAKK